MSLACAPGEEVPRTLEEFGLQRFHNLGSGAARNYRDAPQQHIHFPLYCAIAHLELRICAKHPDMQLGRFIVTK